MLTSQTQNFILQDKFKESNNILYHCRSTCQPEELVNELFHVKTLSLQSQIVIKNWE